MDISKVKAAIAATRAELKAVLDATVEAGKKDVRQFRGVQSLATADTLLGEADEKLEDAVKRVQPRVKKERKKKEEPAAGKKK